MKESNGAKPLLSLQSVFCFQAGRLGNALNSHFSNSSKDSAEQKNGVANYHSTPYLVLPPLQPPNKRPLLILPTNQLQPLS